MCGAGGSLTIEDGDPKFVVAEDGLKHCRILTEGRKNHFYEIMETQKQALDNLAEIEASCQKYSRQEIPILKSAKIK